MIVRERRLLRLKLLGISALAVTAFTMANLVPTGASASPARKHGHPIRIIVLRGWVHYPHRHAQPGPASNGPQACYEHTFSEVDASRYVFFWDGITWFSDGPGGKVTGSITRTTRISATISVGAEISINELFADSKVTVSAAVTKEATTTTGHTYEHNIPANLYGNIEYGVLGYQLQWSRWHEDRGCRFTELDSGSGTVPTVAQRWRWFTTTS
jgi:hypothetical protein